MSDETSSQRFTAWLSVRERARLKALAASQGTSDNYLVRIALRHLLFDNEIPDHIADDAARLQVTPVTQATEAHT